MPQLYPKGHVRDIPIKQDIESLVLGKHSDELTFGEGEANVRHLMMDDSIFIGEASCVAVMFSSRISSFSLTK